MIKYFEPIVEFYFMLSILITFLLGWCSFMAFYAYFQCRKEKKEYSGKFLFFGGFFGILTAFMLFMTLYAPVFQPNYMDDLYKSKGIKAGYQRGKTPAQQIYEEYELETKSKSHY